MTQKNIHGWGADMDSKAHLDTYHGFMKFLAVVAVLTALFLGALAFFLV